MSDTPRTDYEIEVNQLDRFEADWPRKLERECDELRAALVISEKKEMATRAVIESWKSMNLELVPNVWTLEHFKSICDIKTPEAAMVSGEQLLELLTDYIEISRLREELATSDKKVCLARACLDSWKEDEGADANRLEWILESIFIMDSPYDILSSREAIDKAMEASNHE